MKHLKSVNLLSGVSSDDLKEASYRNGVSALWSGIKENENMTEFKFNRTFFGVGTEVLDEIDFWLGLRKIDSTKLLKKAPSSLWPNVFGTLSSDWRLAPDMIYHLLVQKPEICKVTDAKSTVRKKRKLNEF